MKLPWETFNIEPQDIPILTAKLGNCKYKLGAKAPASYFEDQAQGQLSELDFLDCSAFVRLLIFKACGVVIPDGSWNQGRYFEDNHFKVSDTASCKLKDGILRLAWMLPKDGGGVGHIAFVLNGKTYESWGGHGPGSRLFSGLSKFQRVSKKFVIARP